MNHTHAPVVPYAIRPKRGMVKLEVEPPAEATASGLVLPEGAELDEYLPRTAIVRELGAMPYHGFQAIEMPWDLHEGQRVVLTLRALAMNGWREKSDGPTYIVVPAEWIHALVDSQ